jgi:uncharacterized radical SAM protein YgiQ
MQERDWDRCDFVLVSGDAYVDHPSFAAAIISRTLESAGFRVGIIAQPDWRDPEAFRVLGEPRLAFLVSPGNIDSMVSHYTVNRKIRSRDAYSPGGESGKRPDRAAIVYTSMVRQAYKGVPVILGGLEASLRRLSHYDYWSDKVRRSVLLDAKADLLVYGMGERTMVEIADQLDRGIPVREIREQRGTVYAVSGREEIPSDAVILPSYEEVSSDKGLYAESFQKQYRNTDPVNSRPLAEACGGRIVIQNRPAFSLSREEMDRSYGLPYTRKSHPSYDTAGGVPALEEVSFSLVHNRGCFGSCHFCALTFHQGRIISSRSHESVLEEARELTAQPGFKGYIHDVGGPTANFRRPACAKQLKSGACPDRSCLTPEPCAALDVDHSDYLKLLRKLRDLAGVKKVFIRSGVRFDYLLQDRDQSFLKELCEHHVSGQLKVAPEHVSSRVLALMNKQKHPVYRRFMKSYREMNRKLGKKQYLVPYFISSHPGSTLKDAVELALFMKESGFIPDQVQDFYPPPGTVSTCMYHTGINPLSGEPVEVVKKEREKRLQRALLQYDRPENHRLVIEALEKAGRKDLIGSDPRCLVSRRPGEGGGSRGGMSARPAGAESGSGGGGRKPGRNRGGKSGGRHRGRPGAGSTGGRGPSAERGRKGSRGRGGKAPGRS